MDSNRHFVRVKSVDFEGDIYFFNRIRPTLINLSFSMGWPDGRAAIDSPDYASNFKRPSVNMPIRLTGIFHG